jgi:hypothetical protein
MWLSKAMNLWAWCRQKKVLALCWALLCTMVVFLVYVNYLRPPYKIGVDESNLYDAGRVKQGDVVKHVFEIRNSGRKPVSLAGVVSSCSCTAVVQGAEKVILPGKGMSLPVTFNTRGKYGLARERITLRFDTPELQPIVLGIQAMVAGPVQWSPWRVNFGICDRRGSLRPRVVLIRANDEDSAGTWVAEPTNTNVSAKVVPIDRQSYPEVGSVLGKMMEVSLAKDAPVGILDGEIVLKVRETGRQLCAIPIQGRVQGDIYPVPRRLFVGEMPVSQTRTAIVEIRRATGCNAQVQSIHLASSSLGARLLETCDKGPIAARIEVSGKGTAGNCGAFVEKMEIETTDPSQKRLSVEVVGIYVPSTTALDY